MANNYAYNQSRKSRGVCIECEQPIYNNTYRCYVHTLENRQRAAGWKAKNNTRKLDLDHMRRIILMANGICYCQERNPIVEGRVHCAKCLERSRNRNHNYERYWANLQIRHETGQLGAYKGHRPERIGRNYAEG